MVYVRTDMGGAYRWDSENELWIQLLDWVGFDEWSKAGVDALATDAMDPDRLYLVVGTYTNSWDPDNGYILRSTDRGETFEATELPFKAGGNMPGRSMGERLMIDPNDNSIIYYGARSGNGLWKSTDYGVTWSKVESFPNAGTYVENPDYEYQADIVGLSWITFDPTTGSAGEATQTIYVGVADKAESVYRSTDGGVTWEAVPGQPTGYLPHHGVLASTGMLYISYSDGVGPYDGEKGEVWKFDTKTGEWTEISPVPASSEDSNWGYGGIAVDAQNPDTVMVATLNTWWPDEHIYRSTDGGESWTEMWQLGEYPNRINRFTLDYSIAPWLDWGDKNKALPEISPKLGWMIGDLEIDPFNSDRIMYGTGATIWGSENITALDTEDGIVHMKVMANGIEETNVLGLISPPSGAPLISSMGDIGGFRHADLTKAPEMMTNPLISNSHDLDYAELNPDIVVRVGEGGVIGISTDNGKSWIPGRTIEGAAEGGGWVALSADASSLVWAPAGAPVSYSTDLGQSWTASQGIPADAIVSSDRVNPNLIYGLHDGVFYVSKDGGATFEATVNEGLPTIMTSKIKAVPGQEGHVWLGSAKSNSEEESVYGLWQTADAGQTFTKLDNIDEAATVGFGKAAPGEDYMAIYTYGNIDGQYGIFRSDDAGATWIRINDDKHQFASANRAITGDPRVYGRVYVGGNGFGINIGDIAGSEMPEYIDNSGESTTASSQGVYQGTLPGGWLSAWGGATPEKTENDSTPIDSEVKYNGIGAMKYNITAEDDASGAGWNSGMYKSDWSKFDLFEFEQTGYLQFMIKGAEGGENFNIQLMDGTETSTRSISVSDYATVGTDWTEVRIPIADFAAGESGVDLSQVGIVLSGSPVTFWIAEIVFEKEVAQSSFEDLGEVEWAKTSIEKLTKQGIIKGTSASTFSPLDDMTKSEFFRLLTKFLYLTGVENFVDGQLTSIDSITRLDMMLCTAKALEVRGLLNPEGQTIPAGMFEDQGELASDAAPYIAALVNEGIIKGDGTLLNLQDTLTRAEAVVLLDQLAEWLN
ncbi:S-layer homology domain-containing protein [Marinicrinis lubricantis]|uniref:S-layer homology domain-containing protein n=1 Tax=Marinicrinis lubricantis TaxID=2086470 RepID=A0ABW1IST5_9BACL